MVVTRLYSAVASGAHDNMYGHACAEDVRAGGFAALGCADNGSRTVTRQVSPVRCEVSMPIHTIQPVRWVHARAADSDAADSPADGPRKLLRGRALVFWDPTHPSRKRDAIDTDQITPAADCVSESLDAIDVKWKEGAFRNVMPDFRQRVHRGETFIVAGDRFAIGSSREMSPAGMKAIAEEVGLELVVVCGRQVGDIFRRNAINIGLHVLECPEAVHDAGDGDTFAFDPVTRRLVNETRHAVYEPAPVTPKEEEILRGGGIIAMGRREFRRLLRQDPAIVWPNEALARDMSVTQQILWAHRVDGEGELQPGTTLRVYCDLLPVSDATAPLAIHTFNQITGGDTIAPRQAAIASDHFVFTGRASHHQQTAIGVAFAKRHGLEAPYVAMPGDGIFHFYFPEQRLIYPGQFVPGADSHSRAYGAYGAVGIGVGSSTVGFGWATGYVYITVPRQRRVRFVGRLQPWVSGKDIVLELLRRWGAAQSQGMSVELVDVDSQLPMAYRNTMANMMTEAEAWNAVFASDAKTTEWCRAQDLLDLPYPVPVPGANAVYDIDEKVDLSQICPMIARPFSPGNGCAAADIARERISFAKALIGSCTNGSYADLLQAAMIIRAARERGVTHTSAPLIVLPGSRAVASQIERPESRLGGDSVAGVLRSVSAQIRDSWCGPCLGQGPDALTRGERAITTFNRNWQNRMGVGGEGYLASPAIVASSALLGYIGPPEDLGLNWDPERFAL